MPAARWIPCSGSKSIPMGASSLFVPKAEMGQGIHTALAQIAAEELEVAWEKLEVQHASTSQADDNFRGTSGSMSVTTLYDPLRQAAATLRETLRAEAARVLNQPADALVARDGGFELAADPGTRVSYGDLVAGAEAWQVPENEVPLKPPSEYKFIGQSLPRVDLPAKVTGEAIFGYDARAEGLLYGAAVHRPTIEAKMLSAGPGEAAGMPGVVKVVIEDDFAGVVAESRPPGLGGPQCPGGGMGRGEPVAAGRAGGPGHRRGPRRGEYPAGG